MKNSLFIIFISVFISSTLTLTFVTKSLAKPINESLPFKYNVIKPVTDVICIITYRGESFQSSNALSISCVYKPNK